MLLGHWIEMRAINNASKALESLASLMPDTANRITENGETEEVQIDDIKAGDLLLVKPGEKIRWMVKSLKESRKLMNLC